MDAKAMSGTEAGRRPAAGLDVEAADLRPALARAAETIRAQGHAFVEPEALRGAAPGRLEGKAWAAFAGSWDDLRPDTYMADGGRYRLRRHAAFHAAPGGGIERLPNRPHYQTLHHNPLNGGLERWFEPVTDEIAGGEALMALLGASRAVFDRLSPGTDWLIEMHQFRIEARGEAQGKPTPEGMHRDGVDYVLVTLVGRHNVQGGVTGIRVDGREGEESFTLEQPLDSVLLDDHRVWHGVTPVRPLDPALPGHRDVLVLTFRREG